MVYVGLVDGERFNFMASGSLWHDALVMLDEESGSLWSQISGECIKGPKEGTKLQLFKSNHTTVADFKKQYPNGVLLKKPEKGLEGSVYNNYFASPGRFGVFGRMYEFEKIPQKSYVYGLRLADKDISVTKEYLSKNNYTFVSGDNYKVIMVFDSNTESIAAFYIDPNLDYKVDDNLILAGENSWNAFTGQSIDKNIKALESIPVISAYWFAWFNFFPNTELIN